MSVLSEKDSFYMNRDQFKDFLKILNLCSDICNDFHVVNGKILQRTNSRTAIIKCDLSSLFRFDGGFVLPNIKHILENLKGLDKIGPFRFKRAGTDLKIKDAITSICIPANLDAKYCDNKMITDQEFNQIANHGPLLLETELDEGFCDLLKRYAKLSNNMNVTLSIRNQKATLDYQNPGGIGISSRFKFKYRLAEGAPDIQFNLPTMPFSLKCAVSLAVYAQVGGDRLVDVFKTVVNENIMFEIYTTSAVIGPE